MVLFVAFLYARCSFCVLYLEFIYRSILFLYRENIDLRIMPICLCYFILCYFFFFFVFILKANTKQNNNKKVCDKKKYEVNVSDRHNIPKNHKTKKLNTNIMLKFNRHKIEAFGFKGIIFNMHLYASVP